MIVTSGLVSNLLLYLLISVLGRKSKLGSQRYENFLPMMMNKKAHRETLSMP